MPQITQNPDDTVLVSLNSVGIKDGDTVILNGVSFQIHAGEIVTIIGPNGAGKTTLLKVVLGVRKQTQGTVWRKKGLTIGYMPQKLPLPKMIPMTAKRFLRLDGDYPFDVLQSALETAGISDLANRDVHLFSGGEIQRLLLARTLLRKPDLLVLDEPVQNLDAGGEEDFYTLLDLLNKKSGCAVLMVSHDLHVVMSSTNKVICLNKHVCCEGKPSEIAADKSFETLFHGGRLALYEHRHNHKHLCGGGIEYDHDCAD